MEDYLKYRGRERVLEYESYFTKPHSTVNGNDNCYSDSKLFLLQLLLKNIQIREKLLGWIALSLQEISL